MLVSLLPGVEIFARFPSREDISTQSAQVAARIEEKEKQVADRDRQLLKILSQAQELLQNKSGFDHAAGNARRKKPGGGKRDEKF
jgi:hypothetical protein